MSELDPEARRILSLARAARTPSPEDQARVARRFALAAGISAAAVTATGTAKAVEASSLLAPLKLLFTGSALLGAALGTYLSLTPSPPQPSAARQVTNVPLPLPVPLPDPAQAPAPAPSAPPPPRRQQLQAPPTLPAELELLHAAQTAWRSQSPSRTLELLESHRQRYPRSQLRAERETLEILALCELGQTHKAARLTRRLLAREPHSPARAAIEQSCGIE